MSRMTKFSPAESVWMGSVSVLSWRFDVVWSLSFTDAARDPLITGTARNKALLSLYYMWNFLMADWSTSILLPYSCGQSEQHKGGRWEAIKARHICSDADFSRGKRFVIHYEAAFTCTACEQSMHVKKSYMHSVYITIRRRKKNNN